VSDTYELFEAKYRISVCDFLHKYDEALYRKLESEVLKSTESIDNVVVATGGRKTKETAVHTDGQEIYKHSLGILIGKEIRGCKIIDAFYWDHKINMICIKDNEFYKMKVSVYDMKETYKDGTFQTRVDVDVSKEVADIFQGEINGETIQK
jgi:hypothetical protein